MSLASVGVRAHACPVMVPAAMMCGCEGLNRSWKHSNGDSNTICMQQTDEFASVFAI